MVSESGKKMGRNSCCEKQKKMRKGLWSPDEDEKLYNHIMKSGVGCWSSVPKLAGLQRCGKSCRLRWINYLRPDLKRGMFAQEEEELIINLQQTIGNRWAQIAAQLPGRTDNEIKNFWNSCLRKKLIKQGIDPITHKPMVDIPVKKDESECCNVMPSFATSYSVGQVFNDPVFLPGFEQRLDPNGNQLRFLSDDRINPVSGFDFKGQNMVETACSYDSSCSSSRMNAYVKESSSSSMNPNNNMVENGVVFSWGCDNNKMGSNFQFGEIQRYQQLDDQNGGDYCDFPLASLSQELASADIDCFQHL